MWLSDGFEAYFHAGAPGGHTAAHALRNKAVNLLPHGCEHPKHSFCAAYPVLGSSSVTAGALRLGAVENQPQKQFRMFHL